MRYGSPDLQNVLAGGSFSHHFTADLYYNGELRHQSLPITSPQFGEDADGDVQQTGSVSVVWQDDFGSSITPQVITDPLAPYGAELQIWSVIEAGNFRERVEYGWFPITDVPQARDQRFLHRGVWFTEGSLVDLELKERLAPISEETFDVPTAPDSLGSAWAEIARICGYPISRTVDDTSIPRSVMYDESKLEALYDLMGAVLLAAPHMTADGALAARPTVWPDYQDTIYQEQIESVGSYMSSADVKNRVVVRAGSGEDATVLAVREITSGPLRVRNADGGPSPFRARTRYLSSQYVTTKTQAGPWADAELAQVSTPRARALPVVEAFNPLRERGDVVRVERDDRWLIGRVATIARTNAATQALTVEVGEELPKVTVSVPWVLGDIFTEEFTERFPGRLVEV